MPAPRRIRPTASVQPPMPPLLMPQPAIPPLVPPVHVVDLNKLRQQIRDVLDGIAVVKVQLTHPPLRELSKERSNGVICRNFMPCFFNHAPFPLLR